MRTNAVALNCEAQDLPNPVGRANVRSRHAGCSATFARAAVAPLTPVAHLRTLGGAAFHYEEPFTI